MGGVEPWKWMVGGDDGGRKPARFMGRELGRWQKGNWGRDGWASNKAGTRQRDLSGRQMGPSEAKGPHVSESPLIFPSKS